MFDAIEKLLNTMGVNFEFISNRALAVIIFLLILFTIIYLIEKEQGKDSPTKRVFTSLALVAAFVIGYISGFVWFLVICALVAVGVVVTKFIRKTLKRAYLFKS